jgi:hypothetical protein
MMREMEFAKCIALLRKAVRMELITETEYIRARNKLMDRFLILPENEPKAA